MIFGWDGEGVLGMPITAQSAAARRRQRGDDRARSIGCLSGHEPRETAVTKNYRKDGNTIWCEWYHSALVGEDGKVVSILSFVQDVSSRIQAEERLQYMATRDALTGLPNRLMLQ